MLPSYKSHHPHGSHQVNWRETFFAAWAVIMTVIVSMLVAPSLRGHEFFASIQSEPLSNCYNWYTNETHTSEDPWKLTKWTPRPSRCTVQGFVIEELDPDYNFRRGFALGFVDDVEDKTQVLPYMRATVDLEMHKRGRRVYLDFGGNLFTTSATWFSRMYPLDFTEMHVFEVQADFFVVPEPLSPEQEESQLMPMNTSSRVRPFGAGPPALPNWLLKRIKSYRKYVGIKDDDETINLNIARWMKEELKLTPEDTVVVKMDIEHAEWLVLPEWMKDPDMPRIVDELFVEVHYGHKTMTDFGWLQFSHTREEAVELLQNLRRKGFYVHTWT